MTYATIDVKEFRALRQFTGAQIVELINDNHLDDYLIRGCERVDTTPVSGLSSINPFVFVLTFARSRQ